MTGMKLSRFAKGILYLAVTAVMAIISALLQGYMLSEGNLETGYFRSDLILFILAAVLMGIGAYSFLSYTRRHREHRADSLYLFLTGAALMVLTIVVFLQFGGMEGEFTESGYTAANVNIGVLSALPLPFLARAVYLAFTLREAGPGRRLGLLIACGAVALTLVVLAATGGLMRLVKYEGEPESSYGTYWTVPQQL